jgi:dihydroorotase
VFLGSSTGSLLITDWQATLPRCYALSKPVIIHAEDEAQIRANIQQIGIVSPLDHPQIRNSKVAEDAVLNIEQSLQELSTPPCNPIIVAHISTYRELEIIQRLQQQQLPVLSEVTLHHLYLNLDDFEKQPNLLKANPPLRSKEETAALQQALRQEAITFVSSDHAPHTLEEKYSDTPPSGVPGMEYNALLLFDAFVKGDLSLHTIITACATNPSRYFELSDTGKIETNRFADCTLLDPIAKTTIDNADVQSKAGFTPFHGRTVHGTIEGTMVNGDIGFWRGEFFPTRPRDLFPQ